LLEDDRLDITGVCGTSAGAMNAAALTYGLARGGSAEARATLGRFWAEVGRRAAWGPFRATLLDRAFSIGNIDFSPAWIGYDLMSRVFSPYVANPGNYNPLVEVLDDIVDFSWLRQNYTTKMFVCATNVKTGRIRVFTCEDMTAKAVLASACLPSFFQAVEIDGEFFWDGGYMGNPPLYPIIYHCDSRDVCIIQLNPIKIPELPRTAQAILDRINTLSFNSSLMREMRAIHFVTKLVDSGFTDGGRLKRMLIHTVDAEDVLAKLGASSKLNADWDFLTSLRDLGRQRGEAFLAQHFDKIGKESSTTFEEKFL
jgi:NTE family protein